MSAIWLCILVFKILLYWITRYSLAKISYNPSTIICLVYILAVFYLHTSNIQEHYRFEKCQPCANPVFTSIVGRGYSFLILTEARLIMIRKGLSSVWKSSMNLKYSCSLLLYVKIFQFFPDIVDTVKHFSSTIFSMSMCHLFNVRPVVEHVNYILQVQYV